MSKINKLIDSLKNLNIDAVLITSKNNRIYFSGFNSSEGAILIVKNEAYFLVDFRYYEAAKYKVKNMKVILMESFSNTLKRLLKGKNINHILVEYDFVTLSKCKFLELIFSDLGISIIKNNTLDELISNMRMVKSYEEIKSIKIAQEIAEYAFNKVLKEIKEGVRERDIALRLEYLMREQGAESVAFDLIVVSGKNTELPHGEPTDKEINNGDFITIDMGATFNGYKSDMTRTVALGSINSEQKEVYDTVLKAQLQALLNVKAGVNCSDLDKFSRDIIDNSEFKGTFGHALGHGVGLDIHERPSISKKSKLNLKENMVITIEPGIYLENKFGVRIEDMVLVKKDGYENFTTVTKDLIIL